MVPSTAIGYFLGTLEGNLLCRSTQGAGIGLKPIVVESEGLGSKGFQGLGLGFVHGVGVLGFCNSGLQVLGNNSITITSPGTLLGWAG